MNMEDAIIVHSPEYSNWVFDPTHPTQGRRFQLARNQLMLKGQEYRYNIYEIEPQLPHTDDLLLVHDPLYVHDVTIRGRSDEWTGVRHDLGDLAKLFVGGTLTALQELLDGTTKLAIHFPGGKHHAQYDHSSGFCVFADLAIAATKATALGHRVAIFDCDAHHGDGTENLLRDNPNVLKFSLHQYGIFPGTGLLSDFDNKVFNFPLAADTDDEGLELGTMSFIEAARAFNPTLIFIACGADGLTEDPLAQLNYTVSGYTEAMEQIRYEFPDMPILLTGAGGYTPDSGTPQVWSESALALI